MKSSTIKLSILVIFVFLYHKGNCQSPIKTNSKTYFTSSAEGTIYQTAFTEINGQSKLSPLRYSSFFHAGVQAHKNINSKLGVFSGLGIKNIGLIQKISDSTVKRRIYTVGIPLGIKIGTMKKGYVMFGGGVDIPFNYREKGFVTRGAKAKFNEWFSDRTPNYMPYAFAGVRSKGGLQLKLQYYPGNFFNTNYLDANNVAIYKNYSANIIFLSIGTDMGSGGDKKKFPIKKSTKPLTI
jgi:hypothetical protein